MIEVASIVVIVAWNAFFVAAEYAFVTVRRTRLLQLESHGSRRARRLLEMVADPTHFISAMQLAVTVSSLALGAVGEPAFSRLVARIPGLGGATAHGIGATVAVIVGFAMITTLHVVLGEIVPKTIGLGRAERVALAVATPVRVFFRVFAPAIWLLQHLSQLVNRALHLDAPEAMALVHSEDELKMLVSASKERGVLEAEEQQMLHKVFDFGDTDVDEVMVPRPDIVALPMALTPRQASREVQKHPYTRYPVYRDGLDDIVGLLHIRTLYDALGEENGSQPDDLASLLRPAFIVPETKPLGVLLGEMRRTHTHMAVVVDEYGSTAGIVTLEDLIEEIVGEIDDEFDRPDVSVLRISKDRIRVAGSFPIEEFNDRFGRQLSSNDYNTLGGYVFGELGRAPRAGDVVGAGGCRFIVHEVDGARIVALDVEFPEPATIAEGRDSDERS